VSARREGAREEKEGEKDRKRKCHRARLIRFAPSGPVNRETDGSTAEICSRLPNASSRLRRVKFSGRLDYSSFTIIFAPRLIEVFDRIEIALVLSLAIFRNLGKAHAYIAVFIKNRVKHRKQQLNCQMKFCRNKQIKNKIFLRIWSAIGYSDTLQFVISPFDGEN